MFSKAEERFLKEAQKLDLRLKNRRLVKPKKINQAIGRLKAKHPRVQRYYETGLRSEANPVEGLRFESKERQLREHRELFGCYVLRTDRQDLEPEKLWNIYIGLTQAEEGFRALKTDLGLRPNFHQKEERVDGHIFITVIAYHLWKWIRQKLDDAGDTRDWVTVRGLLRTHCYATGVLQAVGGNSHSLFVKEDGTLWAMGQNEFGQLGDDTVQNRHTPIQVAAGGLQVGAGTSHSLILSGGLTPQSELTFVEVGDPGNPADDLSKGSVNYPFAISQTEVPVGSYVNFLNAVAGSDPNGLWSDDINQKLSSMTILK